MGLVTQGGWSKKKSIMEKEEYINKFIDLDTCFELAAKHNDEQAMSEIGDEIQALHQQMRDDLTEEECFEVCVILDSVVLKEE